MTTLQKQLEGLRKAVEAINPTTTNNMLPDGYAGLSIKPAPKGMWPDDDGCICISVQLDKPGTKPTYVVLDREGNAKKYALGEATDERNGRKEAQP
jgi:hypothetical protein